MNANSKLRRFLPVWFLFLVMCAVTGILASIGLIEDRVEIVIGSMLVSPLLVSLMQSPDDEDLDRRTLFLHNAALYGAGISCIALFSFLSTLTYNLIIGLDPTVLSSELEARAMRGGDITRVLFVNVAISVPSGFLYAFVRRVNVQIESLKHSSHIIGIAISTALAPPAGAIGILLLAYVVNQQKYLRLYNIGTSLGILFINTWGILLGVFIAYIFVERILGREKIKAYFRN